MVQQAMKIETEFQKRKSQIVNGKLLDLLSYLQYAARFAGYSEEQVGEVLDPILRLREDIQGGIEDFCSTMRVKDLSSEERKEWYKMFSDEEAERMRDMDERLIAEQEA